MTDFDIDDLSDDLRSAKEGSRRFDQVIATVFGRNIAEPWSTRFEVAADLFKQEFEPKGWSRECLCNSCQGIYWMLSGENDEYYTSLGETDALALCGAMVKAKQGEGE